MAQQRFKKNIPPLLLPQKVKSFDKYNQQKWKKPLPQEYKKPAKAIKEFELSNVPLENVLDPTKNRYVKDMYNLAILTLQRSKEIDYLLKKIPILQKNPSLDPWMARVLITDLLWGKQYLSSGANEVETIKYFEEDLREAFTEVTTIIQNPLDSKKVKFPTYVRINTLSISIEDSLRAFCKEGWTLLPRCNSYSDYLRIITNLRDRDFIKDYHISELLVFPPGTIFYDHPGYLKGKFLLQDKGSCLSSFLLNPKQGSLVLDICAAPGLKTNHLANIMNNTGIIYANDIHPVRCDTMYKLLQLTDVKCVKFFQTDYLDLKIYDEDIKYILIDPTCTYSGIFFGKGKTPQKVRIQRYQFTLSMTLRHTLQHYPNVKRVVYTTCSLYPEECEVIVDDALKEVGDSYTLLDIREMLWNQWESMGLPEYICGNKCLRIVPEVDLCHGYFIAVFERNFDVPVPPYVRRYKKKSNQVIDDEVEVIEKVNEATGKVTKINVCRGNLGTAEPLPTSQKNIKPLSNKKRKYLRYKEKMEKLKQKQTQKLNKNLNINNPGCDKFVLPQEVDETTHNQLYP